MKQAIHSALTPLPLRQRKTIPPAPLLQPEQSQSSDKAEQPRSPSVCPQVLWTPIIIIVIYNPAHVDIKKPSATRSQPPWEDKHPALEG